MIKQLLTLAGTALLSGLFFSCTTTTIDPAVQAVDANEQSIQAYIKANNITATRTTTGLYYTITKANATGKQPAKGEEMEFQYLLSTLSGTKIDSTTSSNPAYVPFGAKLILTGLEEGLSYMHEGEKATLLVPSALAYGNNPPSGIESYAAVRFDVTLVRSRTEEQQITEYITNQKLTVTQQTSTGLRVIKTTAVATGDSLTTGKVVTVGYTGRLMHGTTAFDAGTFDLTIGKNQVVAGFEEGITKLKLGEKATLIFPSAIGYGTTGAASNGVYVIPPYSPLIFDIEIKAVK